MATAPTTDAIISLSNVPQNTGNSVMVIWMKGIAPPATAGTSSGAYYFYPLYIDKNNYLRMGIQTSYTSTSPDVYSVQATLDLFWNGASEYADGGNLFSSPTSNLLTDPTKYYPIIVRQSDYTKFDFFYGSDGSGTILNSDGNPIGGFSDGLQFNYLWGLDLKTISNAKPLMISLQNASNNTNWTVALGANGIIPDFKYFSYYQFNDSLNIENAIKYVATQAGIFNYIIEKNIDEKFFGSPDNRTLKIANSGNTGKQWAGRSIDSGEVEFDAQCVEDPTSPGEYGIQFMFRAHNTNWNYYTFTVTESAGSTNFTQAYFGRVVNLTTYTFNTHPYIANGSLSGNLRIDLSKKHTYRVVFIGSLMYGFIDNIMVAMWNDNNSTYGAYTLAGGMGFGAPFYSDVVIQKYSSTAFWKQIPSVSINPGDDMYSIISHITHSIRAWFMGDLFARMKAFFLSSTTLSSYTYKDSIYMQGVNNSDKEYISEVVVYGNGVQATAKDSKLIQNANVREEVIIDYTITTEEDAKKRAQHELINANQYKNQYNPKQTMNVGAELFDVVTVTDTGNNTSGVDSNTRVYAEKFSTGGSKNQNEFSIEIDTGNV